MYSNTPNLKKVKKGYEEYYKSHDFEKNQHTQYYKRFIREYEPYTNADGFINLPNKATLKKQNDDYNEQLLVAKRNKKRNVSANWEELGPWEYDHDATMKTKTQSPGSAHIYTVEQSKSNPNVVYAGAASAGVWKSTDKGLSWNLVTKDLLVTSVKAIAIDPVNENTVYFGMGSKIAKSTNGGITWTLSNTEIGSSNEIKIHPTNNNIILAATSKGLYRSIDAGVSWTRIVGGYMYEVQFHPTASNIIYAIKSFNARTYFYKSIDAGKTFSLKLNGWPGVASTNETTFKALSLKNKAYAKLANSINLGDGSLADFTIEIKIKTEGWSDDPVFFSNKNWNSGVNKGFAIVGDPNGRSIKFNIGTGSQRLDISGGTINDNEWHHITFTYQKDGAKKLFIDGIQVQATDGKISGDVVSGLPTAIYQDGTFNYSKIVTADIGELRVFNTVLNESTIKSNYCNLASSSHPNYSNLVHHYSLEEGTGALLTDTKGSNNGTIIGSSTWTENNKAICITSSFADKDEQKRTEIAVSESNPDLVVALATGDVNGGSGLVGIYKSIDAGETFTFQCCGDSEGGEASIDNKNIVGYAGDLSSSGGQYYYDLGLDISPTDPNRILAAGIMIAKSTDGGVNWKSNSNWVTWRNSAEDLKRYVHADNHDVKFFKNGNNVDLWIANDGGLYYSSDQGETMDARMHGIQGTEFWGFGSSLTGDAMIGGAYHNGTLRHYKNVYLKGKNGHGGWFAGGAGDAGDGYIHEANPKWFFHYGGLSEFPDDRLSNPKKISNAKTPSYHTQSYSNYEWVPYQQEYYYVAEAEKLWLTNDNGTSWNLINDFKEGKIYDVRTSLNNKNTMYLVHQTDTKKYIKKSVDAGVSWIDVTPSDDLVGAAYNKNNAKNIDVSQQDENIIWCIIRTPHNVAKVLKSTNGGDTWTNITGDKLKNQSLRSLVHQQGTDGGIYVGTTKAIYYKNNSMSDFELYNDGLPAIVSANFLYPNYTYQKLRIGTYRGAFQGDFYEKSKPLAKPTVDRDTIYCLRDTLNFKDISFVSNDGASRKWSFPGGIPETSTAQNPKVVYSKPGVYDVELTVTDVNGSHTKKLIKHITVKESECNAENISGKAILFKQVEAVGISRLPINFGETEDFSFSCWIKTGSENEDGTIISDKNWRSGMNKGWILVMQSGNLLFNISDGAIRKDIKTNSEKYNDNKWHYVAVSADRDGLLSLYVDGKLKASTDMSTVKNINSNNPIYMGIDISNRFPYQGLLEEVKIWNAVKTQEELREQRHITANPLKDDKLIAYYQFNKNNRKVIYDRVGTNHLKHFNESENVPSTAPIGGGVSDRIVIDKEGKHSFSQAMLDITLPKLGKYPNGEVVASRIEVAPNKKVSEGTPLNYYWILDNYGENETFSLISSISFRKSDTITQENVSKVNNYKLYKRNENSDDEWGNSRSTSTQITPGKPGDILFSKNINVTSTGQILVVKLEDLSENEVLLNEEEDGILVYPTILTQNASIVTIENKLLKDLSMQVYSIIGQKITEAKIEKQTKKTLELKLSSGVYILQFLNKNKKITSKKIIIN